MAAGGSALDSGALRDIGQALAGLREGKAKEYTVIAILGGKGSGKTSLVNRFIRGTWEPTTPTQRFVDIQSGSLDIRGKKIQVVTCDYAGSSEYRLIQKTMFPPTKAVPVKCMLTIDLSRKDSQSELVEMVNGLVIPRLNSKSPPESYLLAGCKADLKRNISSTEGAGFAKAISEKVAKPIQYIETSAKEGKNVSEAFELLVVSSHTE
nr:ADP-ribosylation factor-like protein [Candidatus Njordarchaeum guaymaensis]